jgi:pimeloyl-ACP methyl ester carboxylesterase
VPKPLVCLRLVMRSAVLTAVTLVVTPGAYAQQNSPLAGVTTIDLDGRAVRVQAIGLRDRRPGQPVVVFEAGASNSLEIWGGILPQVASMAPVVAYDRAGLGRSEWDDTTPTPRHVTDRLRRVLRQISADPPYMLVGFSWGGMLARYFAGYYPDEVVGLILVDPSPMVTESLADNVTPFEAIGVGRAGFDVYWSSFTALLASAPPAVRAENQVLRGLLEMNLADRDLRQIPAVPLVVIVAAKYFARYRSRFRSISNGIFKPTCAIDSGCSTSGSWPLRMAPWWWPTTRLTPFLERIRVSSFRPSSGCWVPPAESGRVADQWLSSFFSSRSSFLRSRW